MSFHTNGMGAQNTGAQQGAGGNNDLSQHFSATENALQDQPNANNVNAVQEQPTDLIDLNFHTNGIVAQNSSAQQGEGGNNDLNQYFSAMTNALQDQPNANNVNAVQQQPIDLKDFETAASPPDYDRVGTDPPIQNTETLEAWGSRHGVLPS